MSSPHASRRVSDGAAQASVVEIRLTPLPRLAGVTSPRERWFGRAAQDQDAVVTREVNSRFWDQGRQSGHEIHRRMAAPLKATWVVPSR
jgi:hypothetical protein